MVKRFMFAVSTPILRSEWTEEVNVEVEDDATQEEIDEIAYAMLDEWAMNKISVCLEQLDSPTEEED